MTQSIHPNILSFISEVKFNQDGLVSTIAQDADTNEVLMLAWQDKESLIQTINKGEMVYFSRSRQKLWHKGETSGHTQKLVSLSLDCDGDAILAKVIQNGGIACHTGRKSCFYKQFSKDQSIGFSVSYNVIKDPKTIY